MVPLPHNRGGSAQATFFPGLCPRGAGIGCIKDCFADYSKVLQDVPSIVHTAVFHPAEAGLQEVIRVWARGPTGCKIGALPGKVMPAGPHF